MLNRKTASFPLGLTITLAEHRVRIDPALAQGTIGAATRGGSTFLRACRAVISAGIGCTYCIIPKIGGWACISYWIAGAFADIAWGWRTSVLSVTTGWTGCLDIHATSHDR